METATSSRGALRRTILTIASIGFWVMGTANSAAPMPWDPSQARRLSEFLALETAREIDSSHLVAANRGDFPRQIDVRQYLGHALRTARIGVPTI